MPYEFVEDVATADIAFRAWGRDLKELFTAAGDATMNVMVEDLATIEPRVTKSVTDEADAEDLLLVEFLQELIYYKDAQRLLLRPTSVRVQHSGRRFRVSAALAGEPLDPKKHEQRTDVKAVTYHRLEVKPTDRGWEAFVILDI
ncbi:MAG: archease [Candidatus Omnitrophica bacterium]|nr:archease [Candidatus Omnitrophota bacterium]